MSFPFEMTAPFVKAGVTGCARAAVKVLNQSHPASSLWGVRDFQQIVVPTILQRINRVPANTRTL